MDTPVIVTVRHPDFENEHHHFGPEVVVIDIDLGSSFDASKIGENDWPQILEWARGQYRVADEVEQRSVEAAAFIRSVAEETLAECLPYDHDGCEVAPYIKGEKTLEVPLA